MAVHLHFMSVHFNPLFFLFPLLKLKISLKNFSYFLALQKGVKIKPSYVWDSTTNICIHFLFTKHLSVIYYFPYTGLCIVYNSFSPGSPSMLSDNRKHVKKIYVLGIHSLWWKSNLVSKYGLFILYHFSAA